MSTVLSLVELFLALSHYLNVSTIGNVFVLYLACAKSMMKDGLARTHYISVIID